MRRIALFLFVSLLCGGVVFAGDRSAAQDSTGIRFADMSLPDALARAQAENKAVFVDCYTKTCGPCKFMAAKVFPQKECGDYFNPAFVSLMRDMEEGEGLEIAARYGVRIYPTFLFINPDGSLLLRYEAGAERNPAKFVEKIDNALTVASMHEIFESGDYTPAFLDEYLRRVRTYDMRLFQEALAGAYGSASAEEIATPYVWGMVTESLRNPDNPLFSRIFAVRGELSQLMQSNEPSRYLMQTLSDEFRVRKTTRYNFDGRLGYATELYAEGCGGAAALCNRILFFGILFNKETDRLPEIDRALSTLAEDVPDGAERASVLLELDRLRTVIPAEGQLRDSLLGRIRTLVDGLPAAEQGRLAGLCRSLGI